MKILCKESESNKTKCSWVTFIFLFNSRSLVLQQAQSCSTGVIWKPRALNTASGLSLAPRSSAGVTLRPENYSNKVRNFHSNYHAARPNHERKREARSESSKRDSHKAGIYNSFPWVCSFVRVAEGTAHHNLQAIGAQREGLTNRMGQWVSCILFLQRYGRLI